MTAGPGSNSTEILIAIVILISNRNSSSNSNRNTNGNSRSPGMRLSWHCQYLHDVCCKLEAATAATIPSSGQA